MIIIFKQVAILFIFALIGYVLSKTKIISSTNSKFLSSLVVWVFLPATTFKSFASNFTVQYIKEKYDIIIVSSIATALIATLGFFLTKVLTKDKYRRSVYSYSLTVPNTGYMGLPLVQAIFPGEVLNFLLFILPINIYLYSIGYCSLIKTKITFKKLINPPLIAIALGAVFGLSGLVLPEFATNFLSTASAPMGPCTMLILGMTLSEYSFGSLLKRPMNYLIAAMRLVIIPSATVVILKRFGLTNVILPALVAYSMPCGLNTVVFPKLVDEDCETGAALALISTAFSMATIPIMLNFFL